jgi:hypothetical protein
VNRKKGKIDPIKSILKNRQNEFIESVEKGNFAEAKRASEWISLTRQIISEHKKRNNIILAILIGTICLAVIAVISISQVKTTNVSLKFTLETLTMKLAENWENKNSLVLQDVWIGNVTKVSSSLNPEIYSSGFPTSVEFLSNNIQVAGIQLNKQTEIDLRIKNNILTLFTNDSLVNGKIGLRKGIIHLDEKTDTLNIPENRPKQFYTFKCKRTPHSELTRMDFSPADTFTMLNIQPEKLNFLIENPVGSGNFESTFLHGKIVLHDTKKEIELLNGENIQVEFTKCRDARFFVEEGKAVIQIMGEVKSLEGGLMNEFKNYKPSLLEYLYHNQRIGLLWSAFIFLLGILFSIKNFFLK